MYAVTDETMRVAWNRYVEAVELTINERFSEKQAKAEAAQYNRIATQYRQERGL